MAGESADEYVLEDEIGRGPLGTVNAGRSPGGEGYSRRVAIKQLRPELASDAEFVGALAAVSGELMSRPRPNVEGVVDVVRFGQEGYLVVEWIDGPSLRTWTAACHSKSEPAPWGLLLSIAAKILFALHALHNRDKPIIHGAISPASIRLDRLGSPMLTRVGVRTALEACLGENRWASDAGLRVLTPEKALTPATDVFGVGLTLYTVLAGAADLNDLPDELKGRLLVGKPVDLSPIRSDVPAVLLRTIERSLASDPSERFESAAAMARSLRFILQTIAEVTDEPAIAKSIEQYAPVGMRKSPKRPPAPPPPPGLVSEETDQLDLNELRMLRIDKE